VRTSSAMSDVASSRAALADESRKEGRKEDLIARTTSKRTEQRATACKTAMLVYDSIRHAMGD
jgi:hypothetical protein